MLVKFEKKNRMVQTRNFELLTKNGFLKPFLTNIDVILEDVSVATL